MKLRLKLVAHIVILLTAACLFICILPFLFSSHQSYSVIQNWALTLCAAFSFAGSLLLLKISQSQISTIQANNEELEKEIVRRAAYEAQLVGSCQSFQELVENISDTAYEVDGNGTITYVSPVITRVLGYFPAELIGKSFLEFIHPEDRESVFQQYLSTLRNESYSQDFRILTAAGAARWVRSSAQAVIEQDKVIGVRGLFVDVHKQKLVEQALQQSERVSRTITTVARDAVILINGKGEVNYWNPAAEKMFGYSDKEAIGRSVHELIASAELSNETQSGLKNFVDSGLGSAIGKTLEFDARRKDGSSVPVELSLAATEMDGDRCAVGIIRDVSDREAAERRIRESETNLRNLFTNMLEGLAYCKALFSASGELIDWQYVEVNHSFSKITGLQNVVGKRVSEVLPDLKRANPEIYEIYGRVARQGIPEVFELFVAPIELWLHISVFSPKPDHFVAVFVDVTKRKLSEIALRDAVSTLNLAKDAVGIGVWDVNFLTNELVCDIQVQELMNDGSNAPLQFDTIYERIHPDDRSQVKFAFAQALKPGSDGQWHAEYRISNHKSGQIRWVAGTGHVLFNEQIPTRMVGIVQDITKRKLAEESLRQSEETFRIIADHVSDVLFMTDASGKFTYLSPSAAKVFGAAPTEQYGTHITTCIADQDVARANLLFSATEQKRIESAHSAFLMKRQDETEFDAELEASAVLQNNEVIGTVGLIRDVTQRNRANEVLRKLQAAVDRSGEVVFMTDDEGIFTYINPAFSKLYGYEPEDVIGKHTPRLLKSGLTDESIYTIFWTALERRQIFRGEIWNLTKAGDYVLVEVSVSPTINERDEVEGYLAVQRDITERRQAELALQESESRFRTVVESLKEGLVITNLEGTFLYVNQALSTMCGFAAEELLDISSDVIVPPSERQSVHNRTIRRVTGEYERYEIQLQHRDGSLFWTEISAGPYHDSQGAIIGTLAIIEDITERKEAEQEKIKLENRLRQAQKMEAIGTLAGGIAHDFNNILTPIMAYTELIMARDLNDPVVSEDLRRVMDAALRAKDLVRQILTFSRQTDHERFSMSPAPIIKEALKLLRATLPATIEIEERIHSKTHEILADPTQFHQIVMNLCTNAAWSMSEKGGKLEVSLEDEELFEERLVGETSLMRGRYVKLTVSDTGCGMDAATLSRIFEPFFTTKKVGDGTGLGLPVVHGIVKSYGGEILASSKPGFGSRFELYFPQMVDVCHPEARVADDSVSGSEHILLVEDEPEVARICARALEHFGYQVTYRTSSVEAFEIFKTSSNSIDLMITDFTMPHLTGVQLTHMLKELKPELPVILMTGFSTSVNEANIHDYGIDAMIMKPVVGRDLAATVRKVFDAFKARAAQLSASSSAKDA